MNVIMAAIATWAPVMLQVQENTFISKEIM